MPSQRSTELDFLRGIAILLVLGRHFNELPDPSSLFYWPFQIWKRAGWAGVDLFFVLSGFLVSGLLFSEWKTHGNIRIGRFYLRRGLKIYPAFYVMLFLSVTWIYQNVPWKYILTEALFVQNYLMGVTNIWSHTWSLAIEEHFYILIGLFIYFLSKRKGDRRFRPLGFAFVLIAAVCLALRVYGFLSQTVRPAEIFLQTHYRIDALFFGVFLSYLHHFEHEKLKDWTLRWRKLLMVGAFFMLLPAAILHLEHILFMNTVGLTLAYLGFGSVLLVFLHRPGPIRAASHPVWRGIAFIGFYSYSIYLWHVPWMKVMTGVLHKHLYWDLGFYGESVLYLVLAVCEGVLMAKMVELPFLKWRDRLFPSRSKPVGLTEAYPSSS